MPNLQIQIFDEIDTLDGKFEYTKSLHNVGKHEEAISYFRILKDAYEEQKQYEKVMDCLGGICQSLGNLGRVAEMNAYLPAYRAYCTKYGDSINKYKLSFYLGFSSYSVAEYETAIEYYTEALKIAVEMEDHQRHMVVLINMLGIYLLINEFEKGYEVCEILHQILADHPEYFSEMSRSALSLNYMTVLLELDMLEQIPEQIHYYQSISSNTNSIREKMYFSFILGRFYLKCNQPTRALSYLEETLELLAETKEVPYYHQVLQLIINVHEELDQYKEALDYSKLLITSFQDEERIQRQDLAQKISREIDLADMKELVYFDGLTNIHNRRYLENYGSRWIEEAKITSGEVYCVVLDIDYFKEINDTHGHIIGDEAIKYVANMLQTIVGETGLCTRYGGDEFVLMFRDLEDPVVFFEELFTMITNVSFRYKESKLQFTISMGVASLSQCKEKSLLGIFNLADRELYKSKMNGRNQISFLMEGYKYHY